MPLYKPGPRLFLDIQQTTKINGMLSIFGVDICTLWRLVKPGGLAREGGASDVCLEAVASFSSVADNRVVRLARASIKSCNRGPDSSSDGRSSGGGWARFFILVMDALFVSFNHVFSLGAIPENSPIECAQAHCQQLNGGSGK